MALNLKYSAILKNAQQDAITTVLGTTAKLQIYSGTQPTNPDTVLGAAVLLVTLVCNATFAPASAGGVVTLNTIANGTAVATGTAAFFRLCTTGGTVGHIDGTVGTSASDLNLNSVSITSGQTVSVTSFTDSNAN